MQVNKPDSLEQPRILIVSVPYALKAADADTLGGKPVSAFVLAEDAGKNDPSADVFEKSTSSDDRVTPSATNNTIPKWNPNSPPVFIDSSIVDDGTTVTIGEPVIISSTTGLTLARLNNVRFCDQFSGANAGAKIAACIANLPPTTGGTADARGLEGAQTISINIFDGVNKPVTLLLGAGQITISEVQTIPSNTNIVGMGRAATSIVANANNQSIFTLASGVNNVRIEGMSIYGTGVNHTASCIKYTDSFNNVIRDTDVRTCGIGVEYAGTGGSHSNLIINSRVVFSNTMNIKNTLGANLKLYHVTFGGGPAPIGIQSIDANTLGIFGGDCEGTKVACVDIDSTGTSGIIGAITIDSVFFEYNGFEEDDGVDIRIGNTSLIDGISITNNTFSAGTTTDYPINIVRGNNVFMSGNSVASGYTECSCPNLQTATNVTSLSNRWIGSPNSFSSLHGADIKLGGSSTIAAPASNLEVQGSTGITVSRDTTAINSGMSLWFRQKNNAATPAWVNTSRIVSNLSDNSAGAESGRLIGEIKIAGTDTEVFNFNATTLDLKKDVKFSGSLIHATPNTTFFTYTNPDTRFVNLNSGGLFAFRNNANNTNIFTISNTGAVNANSGYSTGGSTGTTTTLSCGAGQALKTITVSGGIVTGVTCGAP